MGKNAKNKRKESLEKYFKDHKPENIPHPEECLLSKDSLNLLRSKSLFFHNFPFYVPDHVTCPSGYIIILPETIPGNKMKGRYSFYTDHDGHDEKTESPALNLWGNAHCWNVSVGEYAPGSGPGDFEKRFASEEKAIEYVLDYFFNPQNPHFLEAHQAYTSCLKKHL